MAGVIGVFIPIIMILVVGIVFVTAFYFKSRERQMLIEKGLSADEMKKFFEQKKDKFILLKIGLIAIFFGIGLGIGFLTSGSEETRELVAPVSIFVMTGIGFVVANIWGNKLAKQEKENA